jgi:hypothetical protein
MTACKFIVSIYLLISISACRWTQRCQSNDLKKMPAMNTDKLVNPVVRKAIEALQSGDKKTWFTFFTQDATLFDDGHKMNFRFFFEKTLGHERFTGIDKVENEGLDVYGPFHTEHWGDFKTYFKFHIRPDGKINRLDIGQADY